MKICGVCGANNTEKHHVYYGKGMKKDCEKIGALVWLCPDHHRGQPNGIHGGNIALDKKYKQLYQLVYELDCMSEGISKEEARNQFRKMFDKSYLGEVNDADTK